MKFLCRFGRRPFDVLIAVSLILVGFWDLFGSLPFPPQLVGTADSIVFRIYGFYVAVGAWHVLLAIFNPHREWSRRLERMGWLLITLSTMTMTLVIVFSPHMLAMGPAVKETVVEIAVVGVGALARCIYLRKPRGGDIESEVAKIRAEVHCPEDRVKEVTA